MFCGVPIREDEKHGTSDKHGGEGVWMGKPEGKTTLRAWT